MTLKGNSRSHSSSSARSSHRSRDRLHFLSQTGKVGNTLICRKKLK